MGTMSEDTIRRLGAPMIRDPSDGTIKEKPVIETGTSGLPITKAKAEYLARLEKSREWLRLNNLKTNQR